MRLATRLCWVLDVRVGFIGLGAMGLPMANRLAGLDDVEVVAHDKSSERLAQVRATVRKSDSFEAAVAQSDLVFSVVPADVHVEQVAQSLAQHGHRGQIFVDFSTILPATIVKVSESLGAVGIETVSVALTRSTAAAQTGELVLFSSQPPSGSRSQIERCFSAMATDVLELDRLADPKVMKLSNNMIVAALDVAIMEAIVLGGAMEVSAQGVVDGIRASHADSWALVHHIEKYGLPDDLGPGRFSTRYMAKDVGLFSRMALEGGVPAVVAGLILSQYRGTIAMGLGEHYHMKVRDWQSLSASREVGTQVATEVSSDRLEAISHALGLGVAGVQIVATEEALQAAVAIGTARDSAAAVLSEGSAANSYLDGLAGRSSFPKHDEIVAGLEEIADMADATAVPSILLEATRRLVRHFL